MQVEWSYKYLWRVWQNYKRNYAVEIYDRWRKKSYNEESWRMKELQEFEEWVPLWFALMDTSMDTKLCIVLNSQMNLRVQVPSTQPRNSSNTKGLGAQLPVCMQFCINASLRPLVSCSPVSGISFKLLLIQDSKFGYFKG